MNYQIRCCPEAPQLNANWHDPVWAAAETLDVNHFHPMSSAHRPPTSARLMCDGSNLHGIFKVADRYVRCVRENYFDDVWKDSCVECFLQPKAGAGYFNFEFNCGGAHLVCYITDWRLKDNWFTEAIRLPSDVGRRILVKSSLPRIVEPEVTEVIEWTLQFMMPLTVLEQYVGPIGDLSGQTWRGNFFKCAEEVSHPHWASWAPIKELNFHRPDLFGTLHID